MRLGYQIRESYGGRRLRRNSTLPSRRYTLTHHVAVIWIKDETGFGNVGNVQSIGAITIGDSETGSGHPVVICIGALVLGCPIRQCPGDENQGTFNKITVFIRNNHITCDLD